MLLLNNPPPVPPNPVAGFWPNRPPVAPAAPVAPAPNPPNPPVAPVLAPVLLNNEVVGAAGFAAPKSPPVAGWPKPPAAGAGVAPKPVPKPPAADVGAAAPNEKEEAGLLVEAPNPPVAAGWPNPPVAAGWPNPVPNPPVAGVVAGFCPNPPPNALVAAGCCWPKAPVEAAGWPKAEVAGWPNPPVAGAGVLPIYYK